MGFKFIQTKLSEVILIEQTVFKDGRGFFMETYKRSEFFKAGISLDFIQDNHSKSVKGVLRGLHYQLPPFAQAKLVRCIKGEILDVAVDIRKSSPDFGKWIAVTLSEENKNMLYIPEGFAHGFLTLSEEAEIHYKATAEYSPVYDRSIRWDDSVININWPVNKNELIISKKDISAPFLSDAEIFD